MHLGRLGCQNAGYPDILTFSRLSGQALQRLKWRSYFFLEGWFGGGCLTEPCSSRFLFDSRTSQPRQAAICIPAGQGHPEPAFLNGSARSVGPVEPVEPVRAVKQLG
jgi:hypothetical protein